MRAKALRLQGAWLWGKAVFQCGWQSWLYGGCGREGSPARPAVCPEASGRKSRACKEDSRQVSIRDLLPGSLLRKARVPSQPQRAASAQLHRLAQSLPQSRQGLGQGLRGSGHFQNTQRALCWDRGFWTCETLSIFFFCGERREKAREGA